MKVDFPAFHPLGCSAVTMYFSETISVEINDLIHYFANFLRDNTEKYWTDIVPTYHSLTVFYQPTELSYDEAVGGLKKIYHNCQKCYRQTVLDKRLYKIPVLYGKEFGPDIHIVAEINNLTIEEVISLHSSQLYRIYMIGFLPGFPYLGGLPSSLNTPRLMKPRRSVPEGSVGIGGTQTGVYPISSPGGWNLIGRTPIKLFDRSFENPIKLEAGHYLQFIPIEKDEFDDIQNQSKLGNYELICEEYVHEKNRLEL